MTTSKGTRLSPDARREQLVELGLELLGRTPQEQVSIEAIARAAGISKGLLYHYFPTKSDFVVAVLRRSRAELERRMALPASAVGLTIGERLDASIDGFLGYVSEHAIGFEAIARARGGEDEQVKAVIAENRGKQVDAMVVFAAALAQSDRSAIETPALRVALEGWLAFCEGVVGQWLARPGQIERPAVRHLIRANLLGVLQAAAALDDPANPAPARLAHAAAALQLQPAGPLAV
ncbi:TetR/AcrR family transcriptional regulator [Conexibacter woesei]|uniref:TetR/AcrR family transcriptional regulator n=1 Tax=Conexibacter woesei TaxID=191495 RepID=UPI00040C59D6|nr:TetR/AcrR family transcriptional regulator [Conexibacter woesei]